MSTSTAAVSPISAPAAAPPMQDHKLPLKIRFIGAIDRYHYTVSPEDGCINPPSTNTMALAM